MKTSCALFLMIYAGLTAAYYTWFSTIWDPPATWIASPIVALLTTMAIGALNNARAAVKDWSFVKEARHGLRPRDGRIAAVLGTIHSDSEQLETPFSGQPCVVYEYEIFHSEEFRSSSGEWSTRKVDDYSGDAMNPCHIRTPQGNVRLLGLPNLERFQSTFADSPEDYATAYDYIHNTPFEDLSGTNITKALSEIKDLLTDDDGTVRKDVKLASMSEELLLPPVLETSEGYAIDDNLDPDDFPTLSKTFVEEGALVCGLGLYSAEKNALVPAIASHGVMNRLIRGEPEQVQKYLRGKFRGSVVGGLLALAAIHVAAYGLMAIYRANPEIREEQRSEFLAAAREGDIQRLGTLLARGIDINCRDRDGQTALMRTEDQAVARWLIDHGTDIDAQSEIGQTALMEAARLGRAEMVSLLVEAGADLDLRGSYYNQTALMQAVSRGHDDVAVMLRKAGAYDDIVTLENGKPLPDDGGQPLDVCRTYLQAVYAEDAATLKRIKSSNNPASYTEIHWDDWREVRPREPERFSGYVRDDSATLTLRRTTATGRTGTWTYQLVREDGEWKIDREWR